MLKDWVLKNWLVADRWVLENFFQPLILTCQLLNDKNYVEVVLVPPCPELEQCGLYGKQEQLHILLVGRRSNTRITNLHKLVQVVDLSQVCAVHLCNIVVKSNFWFFMSKVLHSVIVTFGSSCLNVFFWEKGRTPAKDILVVCSNEWMNGLGKKVKISGAMPPLNIESFGCDFVITYDWDSDNPCNDCCFQVRRLLIMLRV